MSESVDHVMLACLQAFAQLQLNKLKTYPTLLSFGLSSKESILSLHLT